MQLNPTIDAGGASVKLGYSDCLFLWQAADAYAEKLADQDRDSRAPREAEAYAVAFLALARATQAEFFLKVEDADKFNADWAKEMSGEVAR